MKIYIMKTYILSQYGKPVAVIRINYHEPLTPKIKAAIVEEVGADENGQFECSKFDTPDFGDSTTLRVRYVHDGELIANDEFTLMRTICY